MESLVSSIHNPMIIEDQGLHRREQSPIWSSMDLQELNQVALPNHDIYEETGPQMVHQEEDEYL